MSGQQAKTLNDFVFYYEAYDGQDVGQFIHEWEQILAGHQDKFCPVSRSGLHEVTEGSCDECGAKNMAG